jgi:hypothetical protein
VAIFVVGCVDIGDGSGGGNVGVCYVSSGNVVVVVGAMLGCSTSTITTRAKPTLSTNI